MRSARNFSNGVITSLSYQLDGITINHNTINYNSLSSHSSVNDDDVVRMHFGLKGRYNFDYIQLDRHYKLSGYHNNIMYTKGLEINVKNLDKEIETFGINFSKEVFLNIAQRGNDLLKSFADRILSDTEVILSDQWRTSTPKMNLIIKEILCTPHHGPLQELYLYSKSIELLVLQAEQYAAPDDTILISPAYKTSLIHAKDILNNNLDNPPTLFELSKLIGLSEFKLKTGFKKLFGLTAYGYLNLLRMNQARSLLLDTDKPVKEIAYDLGFSSPQHFSKAFKKEHGASPNSIRSLPEKTTPEL